MCRLKHLAVAAAIVGLATQVRAGYFPGSTDFEDIDLAESDYWSAIGDATIETVATPAEGRATYRPSWFSTTNKVLSVDNDVATPVVCDLGGDSATASTIYADALVKGAPLANDASVPEVGPNDKLLVYTRVNATGTDTNLCVYAKETSGSTATNEFVLTKSIGKDEWHRIVIKADNGAYQVFCDDLDNPCSDGTVSTFYPINAVAQGAASMSSVAFAGTGAVDDLILSDLIPELPVTTLTWDTSLASVSYAVGNTTNALTVSDGSFEFQPDGPVTLIGNTGFYDVTMAGNAGTTITLTAPTGLAKYSPDVSGSGTENDPYQIPTYGALVAMQVAVTNDAANFAGAYYKQTADIDAAGEAPFAGIGTYAANLNSGVAFTGTYDGQGHKISNIDFTQRNYGGVFNQVKGGTIKNLTVENITCSTYSSTVNDGEWGCAIVGNAGHGATLQNLEAKGSFGTAGTPCRHNVAGIVIRTCGGASNTVNNVMMLETLVKDCTNSATLYGSYTKCAGICALSQDQNGVPNDYVLFDGCVNNANIAMVAGKGTEGRDGLSGIIGYVSDGTKIKDCVNNGTFTSPLATAKIGGIVGWAYNRTLDDLGGNVNAANKVMIGSTGSTITGFKYATVDNGVATTIPPPYTLAKDTEYLLEGNVAASETPVFTLAAAGDTIAFDTALGYTFAGTVAAAAGLEVSSETVGTVTTYTAFAPVAQINGGTKYASFKAAVDAAVAGDLVTVLANCSISESVSFTKDITVTNDYTITASCNYALCIGANVSFGGSGKIERASGIAGSAFCVGANEATRGAITAGTAGALSFDGLTLCGGSGGNLIKLENGTVTMNGGVLKDGLRGIKADADAGSYTSAIVINGGTITNCSAYAVYASAESATGTATITINGGVIAGVIGKAGQVGTETITIPGTSTAKFNADQTAFCESGYETVLSDGWYVVQAKATGYNDPQGTAIEDPAVIDWLSDNGFTQADIDALGNNYAALEKFYEAYIVNYDFRVQGAGVALSFTDITVGNDNISVTVQLVRTAPLGAIHGKLYFYGATDLTAGFSRSPIVDTSVSFTGDETFDTTPTDGTVTQTATATLTFVSDKFFKAQIHAELPDNGE